MNADAAFKCSILCCSSWCPGSGSGNGSALPNNCKGCVVTSGLNTFCENWKQPVLHCIPDKWALDQGPGQKDNTTKRATAQLAIAMRTEKASNWQCPLRFFVIFVVCFACVCPVGQNWRMKGCTCTGSALQQWLCLAAMAVSLCFATVAVPRSNALMALMAMFFS